MSVDNDTQLITSSLESLQLTDSLTNNWNYLPTLALIFDYLDHSDLTHASLVSKYWHYKSLISLYSNIHPLSTSFLINISRDLSDNDEVMDIQLTNCCINIIGNQIHLVNNITLQKETSLQVYSQLFSYFNLITTLEFKNHWIDPSHLLISLRMLSHLKRLVLDQVGFKNSNQLEETNCHTSLPSRLKCLKLIKPKTMIELYTNLMNCLNSHSALTTLYSPCNFLLRPIMQSYPSLKHLQLGDLKVLTDDYFELIMSQNPQLTQLCVNSKLLSRRNLQTIFTMPHLNELTIVGDPVQDISRHLTIRNNNTIRHLHLKVPTTHMNVTTLLTLCPNLIELTLFDHIFPNSFYNLAPLCPQLKRLNLTKYRLSNVDFNQLHHFDNLFMVHMNTIIPKDWQMGLKSVEIKYNHWKFKPRLNELFMYSKII